MLRLTKNIHLFKKIEIINLENTKITTESIKYIDNLEKLNIKIIINKNNIKLRRQIRTYKILLGGTSIAGKTSYLNAYVNKAFNQCLPKGYATKIHNNMNFSFNDSFAWKGRHDYTIKRSILMSDGIILLFNISDRSDFENLPYCLSMITNFYELEGFPVLLIGNKVDKEKAVKDEEIQEFLKKEKFIGYYEVSSKTLFNVDQSFNFMLDYIYKKEKKFPIAKFIKEKGELTKKIKK